jgi:hypothetical protein
MIFYMLWETDGTHIFGLNLSLNALWAKSYSNMTSFICYINNTMIKLTIYFNSLMCIDEQITHKHYSLVNSCTHTGPWCIASNKIAVLFYTYIFFQE